MYSKEKLEEMAREMTSKEVAYLVANHVFHLRVMEWGFDINDILHLEDGSTLGVHGKVQFGNDCLA